MKTLEKLQQNPYLEMDFDGYSIGGFGLGETIEEEFNIVKQVKAISSRKQTSLFNGNRKSN